MLAIYLEGLHLVSMQAVKYISMAGPTLAPVAPPLVTTCPQRLLGPLRKLGEILILVLGKRKLFEKKGGEIPFLVLGKRNSSRKRGVKFLF